MTEQYDAATAGGNPGRPANTTAVTALRALNAAAKLRQAVAELGALYGVRPSFIVGPDRIGINIDISCGDARSMCREALAGDIAGITNADLQPEVDPTDLWIVLAGRGEHNGSEVQILLNIPPAFIEEGL